MSNYTSVGRWSKIPAVKKILKRLKKIWGNFLNFKKKLGRKFWIILAITLVVIGFFFLRSRGKKEAATATVERGQVMEELVLTGTIKAEHHTALFFPTAGKISWVGVAEGQSVNRWQGLLGLDTTVLNAAYRQALNNYRNYQAAADYTLDTVQGHSKDETFQQRSIRTTSEVARDNAYDAVAAAKYNLDQATLLAPFDGIITYLKYSYPGVNVMPTDIQVEIVDLQTVYFDVDADQSEVISIKNGQSVIVVLDSYNDKEIKGKVSFISYTPKPGEAGAVYEVKVIFAEGALGDTLPRIGMTGDAKFVLSQKEDALFVPVKFVNSDKDGKYVNLGKMGNKVRVEIGLEGEENVEILSGVKEGDVLYD